MNIGALKIGDWLILPGQLSCMFVGEPTVPATITAWDVVDTEAGGELEILIADAGFNGGRPVTDRQYRIDGGAEVSFGAVTAHKITGLTDDVEVSVEIRQRNEIGWSEWSDPILRTPTTYTPPATKPGPVLAWDVFDTQEGGELEIVITNIGSDGGSPVIRHEYRLDEGTWVSFGTALSHKITGLTNGVEVGVEVRKANAIGESDPAGPIFKTPTAGASEPTDPIAAALFWPHRYGFHLDAASGRVYSTGTTPAGHQDTISSAEDLTNNGKIAQQTEATERPVLWVEDGTSAFRLDGSKHFDLTPWSQGNEYFVAYAAALDFASPNMVLGNSSENRTFIQCSQSAVLVRHNYDHQAQLSLPSVASGTPFVDFIEYRDGEVMAWRWRFGDAEPIPSSTGPVVVTESPFAAWGRIGRRNDTNNQMVGDLFTITCRSGEPLDSTEREWLFTQLGAKVPEPSEPPVDPPPPDPEDPPAYIEITGLTINNQGAAEANRTTIISAMEAAAQEGKVGRLPAGTIFIARGLRYNNDNFRGGGLMGRGMDSTTLRFTDGSTATSSDLVMINLNNGDGSHDVDFRIYDLTLDGNYDGNGLSTLGIRVAQGFNARIHTVRVRTRDFGQNSRQYMGGRTEGAVIDKDGVSHGVREFHGFSTRGSLAGGSEAQFGTAVTFINPLAYDSQNNNIDASTGLVNIVGTATMYGNKTANTGNMKISEGMRVFRAEKILGGPTAGRGFRTTGKGADQLTHPKAIVDVDHWEQYGAGHVGIDTQERVELLKVGYLKLWDNGRDANNHELLIRAEVVEIDVLEVFDANRGDSAECIRFTGSAFRSLTINKLILRNNRARCVRIDGSIPNTPVLIRDCEFHNNNRGNQSTNWVIEANANVDMTVEKGIAWDSRSTPRQTGIFRTLNGGKINIQSFQRGQGAQHSGWISGSNITTSNITNVTV